MHCLQFPMFVKSSSYHGRKWSDVCISQHHLFNCRIASDLLTCLLKDLEATCGKGMRDIADRIATSLLKLIDCGTTNRISEYLLKYCYFYLVPHQFCHDELFFKAFF